MYIGTGRERAGFFRFFIFSGYLHKSLEIRAASGLY